MPAVAGPSHQHQSSISDFTSIPIAQSLSRPYSADPARATFDPPRTYDRRATFDVSAQAHPQVDQRRYSEVLGADLYPDYPDMFAMPAMPPPIYGIPMGYTGLEDVADLMPPGTTPPGSI